MSRIPFVLLVCLALASAAAAQAAADGTTPASSRSAGASAALDFPACPSPAAEPDDPRWRWRLRAFTHLDCVTTIVDRALDRGERPETAGGEDDTVTISRADLERIRTLAWWARDAAARIGQ